MPVVDEENEPKATHGRIGLIIANTGSPKDSTPHEVGKYLRKFLSNKRIVPMNRYAWKIVLNLCILPVRKRKSAEKYARIWSGEGFQFIRDHYELARKLESSYAANRLDVLVRAAMSFGEPTIEQALLELSQAGCERIAVLPLYPQNAFSQASIVSDETKRIASNLELTHRVQVIGDYSANPLYLDAVAETIRTAGFDPTQDRLLMSFHSIPRIDVDNGDTYEKTVHDTCQAIAARLGIDRPSWEVGFQSRFDKERSWVGPFSNTVLAKWNEGGFVGRLFVVCPNFSVDCLETYYDIMQKLRLYWTNLRASAGIPCDENSFVYVPCLGTSDEHVEVIRSVARQAVEGTR